MNSSWDTTKQKSNYHFDPTRRDRAEDVSTFDWANIPHATANAGHHPRVTFQLTGVITEQTQEFLSGLTLKL